jgi:hypothetical protein
MILLLLKKGARAREYIVALVSLHKDLSVRDHPGHIVQLWGYMALALVV